MFTTNCLSPSKYTRLESIYNDTVPVPVKWHLNSNDVCLPCPVPSCQLTKLSCIKNIILHEHNICYFRKQIAKMGQMIQKIINILYYISDRFLISTSLYELFLKFTNKLYFIKNIFVLVFSIPYETYKEHCFRLKGYSKLSIVPTYLI